MDIEAAVAPLGSRTKAVARGFRAIALGAALAVLAVPAFAAAPAVVDEEPKGFQLLGQVDVPLDGVVPPPPARGSEVEKLELAFLHALIADTSTERMAQARWDDAHEDPSIFDAVMGVDLKTLPATWALLRAVQNDADFMAGLLKPHFARMRPWGVDPTLPNCDAGKGKKPVKSYPSGHSSLGYSVGLMLARLMPAKAGAILERSRDYALSREICGVHFPSDTEASHVVGTIVVERALATPSAAPRIAAARAELAKLTNR